MGESIQVNILKTLQPKMSGLPLGDISEQLKLIGHTLAKCLEAELAEREIHHKWIGRAKVLPDPGRW